MLKLAGEVATTHSWCGCQHKLDSRETNKQIKLRLALFVTYTIIMRSEMCSLHLTHPSGAVGSRHCGARGAVGGSVLCSRVSPQSWTLPARAGIRTHNLGLPRDSSPMLYPLGHNCPLWVTTVTVTTADVALTPALSFSLQHRSRV